MKYLLFITLIFISFESCKKDKYDILLPPETTHGNNIMGFLYNGNIWESISKKPGLIFRTLTIDTLISCKYYHDTSNIYLPLQINASMFVKDFNNKISNNSKIEIGLSNIFQPSGTFNFDTLLRGNRVFFTNYLNYKFYSNFQNSFGLTLTKIDTVSKIISGKFSGTLYSSTSNPYNFNQNIFNLNDSITIRDGRFDVKYIAL